MPSIQSIDIGPDTITLVTEKGTKTLTRADIPANVLNKPIATVETFANTWLATNEPDLLMAIHIFALNPVLIWTSYGTSLGMSIPAQWFAGVRV